MWFPLTLSVIALLVVLGTIGGAITAIKHSWPLVLGALESKVEDLNRPIANDITELRALIETFPAEWKRETGEAKRLQDRSYYRVRRAREELAERGLADGELDQLAAEVRDPDGEGGAAGGVLPLLPVVAAAPAPEPAAPLTWRQITTRRKHGIA